MEKVDTGIKENGMMCWDSLVGTQIDEVKGWQWPHIVHLHLDPISPIHLIEFALNNNGLNSTASFACLHSVEPFYLFISSSTSICPVAHTYSELARMMYRATFHSTNAKAFNHTLLRPYLP